MSQKLTEGTLNKAVRQGLAGRSASSRSAALGKLGIKKQGQGLRKTRKVGIMQTKKGTSKYLRRAGLSLSERRSVMKGMFGQDKAAKTQQPAQDAPAGGKRAGMFSRGDSASRARAQISKQFGSGSGPGFTSDRSSSSSGSSSRGVRPQGKLF